MKTFLKSILVATLLFAFYSDAGDIDLEGNPLKPNECRVGEQIRNLAFTDIEGKAGSLAGYSAAPAVVIAMSKIDCPICQKYAPRFTELEKKYSKQGIAFLLINVGQEPIDQLKAAIQAWGMTARYLPDYENEISKALDARSSGEVFVLDRKRTLVYRGPIDDQYGLGGSLPAPRNNYLIDALEAVLLGEPVRRKAFTAPGCALDLKPGAEPVEPLTYHKQVQRIVQNHCQMCHRPGEAAPFSLLTYDDVKSHASMIKFMVSKNFMPPWFASPKHGVWDNDRSLSARQKEQLLGWLQAGMAVGDTTDSPLPAKFPEGWAIGTPDLKVEIPEAISVPASGVMPYQYVLAQNPLTEDKWIQAVEVQVTHPAVVHHVVVFAGTQRIPFREINFERLFAVRVPGNNFTIYPPGHARKLPAGDQLVFQIHYTPNGIAVEDKPVIGMKFAVDSPKNEIKSAAVGTLDFEIPANAPNHQVVAERKFTKTTRLLGLMPHMHLRGKAFRYELVRANGDTEILLEVPRYDFNWQLMYQTAKPLLVAAGETIRCTAWYDNSDQNPFNPNPNVPVKYGEQTFEEMMFGFYDYYEMP